MKKIPSLFVQAEDHLITREVNPECQWVINGEGKPTAKLDGSSCAVINGKLYKRYDNSKLQGKDNRVQKTTPLETWIHCEDKKERGKFIYWIPVTNKDYFHNIAWAWSQGNLEDGTYELIGPDVQDNPHNFGHNALVKHGSITIHKFYDKDVIFLNPRNFDDIKEYLMNSEWEGIVWHHSDGRMCKITKKKFGLPWPTHIEGKNER